MGILFSRSGRKAVKFPQGTPMAEAKPAVEAPKAIVQSPFTRRAIEGTLPAKEVTK
jgi:hypothetical protein